MVLTADLRDVFFQRDLFSVYSYNEPFLGIAIEDGILSEECNKNWILNAYGEEIYQSIQHERIICVGTVWGTTKEFMNYSKIMSDILNSEWSESRHVIEQAVGNYLIYHDKMFADVIRQSTNYDGYVMTIALTSSKDIKMDSSRNILNGKGEVAAVVHQYDRKPKLGKAVIRK